MAVLHIPGHCRMVFIQLQALCEIKQQELYFSP